MFNHYLKKINFKQASADKKAFTLSEVLITLGIIGIVASMTIPNLIANYQKTQYISQLKKFYSSFNSALKNMSVDNGCANDLKCAGVFDVDKGGYQKNSVYVMTELAKYIKTDKVCGLASSGAPQDARASGCFGYNLNKRVYKLLNGIDSTTSSLYEANNPEDRAWATLMDGTFYGILNIGYSGSPSHCTNGYCALVYVDVNGVKAPNQMGRDVFYFYINDKALLLPARGQNSPCDSVNDSCNIADTGKTCSCSILKESWQMNY